MLVPVKPEAIRHARETAGLTQHQLAREIGIAGGERISKWELGTAVPRLHIVSAMARVLNVELETFLAPGWQLTGIARLRASQELSVTAAAKECHVSVATYERWEKGGTLRGPTGGSLARLAKVMQVSEQEAAAAFQQSKGQR